ncbi:hypothetical protein KIL84_014683 [Mauremys mutica]|uniref:Uncharacterized protein n=1 Tax=Mauremys mutica TaxID=74926 RepID=A0A9D3XQN7_9SAUR|nr:hypothetical protein KIL84_014683 [Mauremys mutica]
MTRQGQPDASSYAAEQLWLVLNEGQSGLSYKWYCRLIAFYECNTCSTLLATGHLVEISRPCSASIFSTTTTGNIFHPCTSLVLIPQKKFVYVVLFVSLLDASKNPSLSKLSLTIVRSTKYTVFTV